MTQTEIDRADIERRRVLTALGFQPRQIMRTLAQGVTVDQLRGMLALFGCNGGAPTKLAEIAARIDRIAELEKLPLDSHTA